MKSGGSHPRMGSSKIDRRIITKRDVVILNYLGVGWSVARRHYRNTGWNSKCTEVAIPTNAQNNYVWELLKPLIDTCSCICTFQRVVGGEQLRFRQSRRNINENPVNLYLEEYQEKRTKVSVHIAATGFLSLDIFRYYDAVRPNQPKLGIGKRQHNSWETKLLSGQRTRCSEKTTKKLRRNTKKAKLRPAISWIINSSHSQLKNNLTASALKACLNHNVTTVQYFINISVTNWFLPAK